MYNGIGLRTVRGSGTNGYVQTNRAHVDARRRRQQQQRVRHAESDVRRPGDKLLDDYSNPRSRRVDPRIAEHELKRRVELRVYEVQAEMEDQGYAEADIEERTGALRKQLLDEAKTAADADARRAAAPPDSGGGFGGGFGGGSRGRDYRGGDGGGGGGGGGGRV